MVAVAGLSMLLSLAGVPMPAGAAVAAPTELDAAQFRLTQSDAGLAPAVAALDTALASKRRTVAEVMSAANRARGALCHPADAAALSDRSGADVTGFCWEPGDDNTVEWYPQGLATSRDAVGAGGQYEGHQLMVVSWYHRGAGGVEGAGFLKGVRISLVDWDADFPNAYRHLELVEPYLQADGTPSFRPLVVHNSDGTQRSVHAGGIAWYGNLLYLADTWYGLRVFDLRKIYSVSTDDATKFGRQPDGSYQAAGYAYVVPQVASVRPQALEVTSIRFSTVSVDRATEPASLVVGESAAGATEAASRARAIRFDLDSATGMLREDGGTVRASRALHVGLVLMQGVVSRGGRFFFATTAPGGAGTLHYWSGTGGTVHSHAWAYFPESLSYWPDPDLPDYLWTLTEHPGHRLVVAVPQADWL
jgi:hypothetical protein